MTDYSNTFRNGERVKLPAHTPGPWKVTDRFEISMDDGDVQPLVATVNADDASVSNEQAEADARLIAAAPDLLDVLRVLTDHAKETYPHFESDRGQRDIAAALAAIAKATGETP